MLDIKEILQDFQKLNKTDNCIVIHLKNDAKLAITSPVSYSGIPFLGRYDGGFP